MYTSFTLFFIFWGTLSPRTPAGALPLDPTGGHTSPRFPWPCPHDANTLYCVNSARPSSGCRGCFPLSAATTTGLRPGVALPPVSPLSRVCRRRRGGSPSGDLSFPPALSLRGCGPKALDRPPSVGRMREGDFPPLAIPVGDEGEFTHIMLLTLSVWSMRFVLTAFRPSDVARGFVWDSLIPYRDLNSMFPADT